MYKVFIIGLGKRGIVHAGLLSLRQDVLIVGGYAPSSLTRQNCRESFQFPVFENLEQGLQTSEPDIVLIATPPQIRKELLPVLSRIDSINTLIVEKPLALSIEEGLAISQSCVAKRWKLFIVHQSRYCEEFIAMKEAITAGKLGNIRLIQAACYGNLYHQGSHMIDLIRWFTNEQKIQWVDATGTNDLKLLGSLLKKPFSHQPDPHPGDLWSSITMRLESGIDAYLSCGLLDANPQPHLEQWLQRRISIVGENGVAHAHLCSHYEEATFLSPKKKTVFTSPEKYLNSLQLFYDQILTKNKVPKQALESHLFTLGALQASLISAKEHRVISVPLDADELIQLDKRSNFQKRKASGKAPLISVILPMETHRGIAEEAILSWTKKQRCDPGLYEVIIVFHKHQQELVEQITAKTGALPNVVCIDAANEIELCHYGATLARGDFLLFTESHCIAEPDAVQQALHFFKVETYDGFYPRTEAICRNTLSQFELKLYNLGVSEFENPDCWAKVTLHAFGIKREVYFAVGGFAHQYNRFAYWIIAADFHQRGYSLGYAPGVGVSHVFVDSFALLDQFLSECTSGEVLFRLAGEQKAHHERYFGIPKEWEDIQKYNPSLARVVFNKALVLLSAKMKSDQLFLRKEVGTLLFHSFFARPYFFCRYNMPRLLSKYCFIFSRKKTPFAWKNFYNYCEQSFVWYRVKFAMEQKKLPIKNRIASQMHYSLATVDDVLLYGFHNPENFQGEAFRWSQKMSAIRLFLNPESHSIRIKLLNRVRLVDTASELVFFIDNDRIERFEINDLGNEIRLRLDKKYFDREEGYWLLILAVPWKTEEIKKTGEKRVLGFPIKEIQLEYQAVSRRNLLKEEICA
ncbi:putative 4,5-dihydroxyphthalate dehydrogenase [Legionella quinlivanii]|uniref:Putative 4,5-dihydroxyphthalate dehydrogenase n=1 Tax=Legionella quinlivanii TaxID=45073 RepID=A0A0W0XL95_9GAMM|nr:Gfo/Idh/MocA family oxidoreductase [Legionella quinlivanii]KTD45234.1 putative 4,5-dihydroxyphthalate dehydrogenase [Legionella quinlivanii]SEG04321.1 Predicted dehydrogenase [Legionella quinlivanii DSM 21216]STY11466.1 Uncharacterized oxidoreductase yvaA [Legionella quinlivanii]